MQTISKPHTSLCSLRSLPPFPPAAAKLMDLVRRENADFRHAVEIMRTDSALTTEVLRLANSASGGARFPVSTLLQALSVLGVNRVISLATTLCVGRLLKPVAKLPVMRRCWRHNLATALIATKRADLRDVDAEKAYTFGLLSGLGRLALLVSNPQLYTHAVSRAETEHMPLEILEHELYGFDQRDAGSYLVTEWRLPVELNTVLFSRTAPQGADAELADLIREASGIAVDLGFGVVEEAGSGSTSHPMLFEVVERVNQIEQELDV